MKAVIFLGPSLSLNDARKILDATYLPPVAQTELVTAAVNHMPDVIGLIDGVFSQSLSVWHKEILYVLEHGTPIYGASSMGALRAAETSAFGMVGVGEIFRQYATGELIDDDEVALVHATADQGYQKLSEPMVNVRATYIAAESAGIINADERERLVAIAKGLFYTERTFPRIRDVAAADGMSDRVLERLASFAVTNYVDLKRQDAVELLKTIKGLNITEQTRKASPAFVPKHSTAFETLYNRDRRVECGSIPLPLESIGNYVALHDGNFDELNFNALNRALAYSFSEMLDIEPSKQEIENEFSRFRKRHDIIDHTALSAWLHKNHLSREELDQLMVQLAACRALHRWLLIAMWMGRTTQVILDELRIKGTYRQWAEKAAAQERLLHGAMDSEDGETGKTLEELLDEHCEWTDCRVDIDPGAWAEEAGFHSESNLKMELSRAAVARHGFLELLADTVPASAMTKGVADADISASADGDDEGKHNDGAPIVAKPSHNCADLDFPP